MEPGRAIVEGAARRQMRVTDRAEKAEKDQERIKPKIEAKRGESSRERQTQTEGRKRYQNIAEDDTNVRKRREEDAQREARRSKKERKSIPNILSYRTPQK
jgi:hypothetical protein